MKYELSKTTLREKSIFYISNLSINCDTEDLGEISRLINVCRLNALSMIYCAGSGHIGTSFSVAEILGLLKFSSNGMYRGLPQLDGSIAFSSKGHDAPMLYAVMHAAKELSDDHLFRLRRLGGLPGHPTIETKGVVANTGSLGMGISKAKGIIYGNRLRKRNVRVNVVLGDGELQEGQIWESLSGAERDQLFELTVIVDANGIQSDSWVSKTLSLGDVKSRVEAMGWNYFECDGNSVSDLRDALSYSAIEKRPHWIQANTTKGNGVTFMEEFPTDGNFYKFHSGAPTEDEYLEAVSELLNAIKPQNSSVFRKNYSNRNIQAEHREPKARSNSVVDVYANTLLKITESDPNVMVMDADLTYDTGTYKVKESAISQYIQFGITEQDMVSTAGAMALNGVKPIVHSFGTFLTMRAYEQIFNNSTENSTVAYVGFLAGLLPGAPGVSHQAVTDFPIMAVLPNMRLFEPATEREIFESLSRSINGNGPSYIRMQSIGSLLQDQGVSFNKFTRWDSEDSEYLILCSGLTMLNQAFGAIRLLKDSGFTCSLASVFDYQFEDDIEMQNLLLHRKRVIVIENSLPGFLLHSRVLNLVNSAAEDIPQVLRIGLSDYPLCGQNDEVLNAHQLDSEGIYRTIINVKS